MPKKFKGENTKAQDARARKAAAKEAADEKRRQEEEDAAWRDDDKHAARKQDRKVCQFTSKIANCMIIRSLPLTRTVFVSIYLTLAISEGFNAVVAAINYSM